MGMNAGVEFTGNRTQDGLIATAMCNFFLLCSVIAVMFVIDVWGRRFLLLLGGGIMFVSMSVAAVLTKMIHDMEHDPSTEETRKMYGYALVVLCAFTWWDSVLGVPFHGFTRAKSSPWMSRRRQ